MTATYSTFISAIAGLTVSGVTRYSYPPASVNTADLPCSFPMLPYGTDEVITLGIGSTVGGQQPTFTCDLVFAIEPVGQGTQPQNFSAVVTLMDAVVTASRAMTRPNAGPTSFSLRMGLVSIAGADYWAIFETWNGVG